ncbi:MAG TPA: hypothetical protein VIG07_10140 [Methylomirabilota bacterium]|jgi:hypothetical protein
MAVTRKPLAKIEGRKRMQASGLTVAWQGTRSLKDWAAYVENGSEQGRLVLADQVSERTVKSLLARIQNLSREELETMGRTVQAVAQQGGGPRVTQPRGGGASDGGGRDVTPGSEIVVQSPSGRQLALSGEGGGGSSVPERSHRRRVPATVEGASSESRRPARASSRDVAGTLRQLRSRVESLEAEQEQLRADLALLRGEAEIYEGPPSIFVTGWFRATLVMIVLAIVVVITVPWLMDLFEGGAREPRPPAPAAAPAPPAR